MNISKGNTSIKKSGSKRRSKERKNKSYSVNKYSAHKNKMDAAQSLRKKRGKLSYSVETKFAYYMTELYNH